VTERSDVEKADVREVEEQGLDGINTSEKSSAELKG
jgi:hypothetical protein